jgi:hypothetical protein
MKTSCNGDRLELEQMAEEPEGEEAGDKKVSGHTEELVYSVGCPCRSLIMKQKYIHTHTPDMVLPIEI